MAETSIDSSGWRPSSRRRRDLLVVAALFLGSLGLYAPSLRFGFVGYDDGTILLAHPNLYDQTSLLGSLRQIFVGYFPREEPLLVRDVTWAIDARLFGFDNPLGYHLGNVILNAADAALLYLFLVEATRRVRFAAITAALWSTLSIHVEPVCWVMGRKDVLSTFFVLLALWTQARALHLPEGAPRRRTLELLTLLLYPLAVLAKFSGIALPGALAALRVFGPFLDGTAPAGGPLDLRRAARAVRGLWPHLLVMATLHLWYGHIIHIIGVTDGRGPGLLTREHLTLLARFTPLVFGLYLENLVVASRHAIFYDWPNAALALTRGQQLLSAGIAALLVGAGLYIGRRRKDLFFFYAAFLLLMVPYLNLVYIGIWIADRYVYLTSFCVLAIAVRFGEDLVARAPAHQRHVAAGAALALVALYAACGIAAGLRHQPAFRDDESLWAWDASRADPSMRALSGRARSLVVLAEQATDPAERVRLATEARRAIDRAEAHWAAVPWLPGDHYIIDARAAWLDLFALRGRAAAVLGAPLAEQLDDYRKGYALSGRFVEAMLAARTLLAMAAATGDEAKAAESLRYYAVYVKQTRNDPARIPGIVRSLELDYRRRWPALAPKVDILEKRYLP